ncbi:TRAP transporter large permease [Ferruginivarius sediminum]|uniref:TRAP transporter large permease protein n=1 Tax=Ferruginivarius sediminum TaxID=2661937 RepID=A0A369TAM0_9PROT|nr:TRAP transporter large permease [Ferruginivarius sediminum]RDD61227.1 TRAP transporter large permease [Ferruginivarius sediminum]
MTWGILAASLVVLLSTGAVLGAGLGLVGFALLHFEAGGASQLAVMKVWNVFTDFTLSAVPIFIFLGDILLASGISDRVYNGLSPLFHRVPGKLLHTNIAVCTIFGAVSGSSTSTAAAIGSVGYPELSKRGYDGPTIIGSLAAGGTLGLLIPPSLALLIYGATQNVSIGKLFLAGIVPGVMIAGLFSLYIMALSKARPDITPDEAEKPTTADMLRGLSNIWPLPILIFFVLGTIYLGLATATEAAALGVAAAIVLGFTWGNLTPRKLWGSFLGASVVFGAIAMVMLGTLILAQAISILGMPQSIVAWAASLGLSRYAVLGMIVLLYLVLGCFFDGISLLLMTLPIAFPVITAVGFDPVWFGVIVTLLMEIGMITPPVGLNLFVLVTMSGQRVNLAQAAWATMPYWLIMLGAIVLLTLLPGIVLFLPSFY